MLELITPSTVFKEGMLCNFVMLVCASEEVEGRFPT